MAIDSEKKRKAVAGIVKPDGTIDADDRRVIAGVYPVGAGPGGVAVLLGQVFCAVPLFGEAFRAEPVTAESYTAQPKTAEGI